MRRLVHAMGLRYRVNARPLAQLRRTADLVFTRRRVAVFIDGCFWHGCPEHHRRPGVNATIGTRRWSGTASVIARLTRRWRQQGGRCCDSGLTSILPRWPRRSGMRLPRAHKGTSDILRCESRTIFRIQISSIQYISTSVHQYILICCVVAILYVKVMY